MRSPISVSYTHLDVYKRQGFLGIKTIEYSEKIEKHHVPGFHYSLQSFLDPASDPAAKAAGDKPMALDMARHTEVYFLSLIHI